MEFEELIILLSIIAGVAVVIGLVWWKQAWLQALDMFDWLHWFAVLIGLAQCAFILWYYIPLMRWRSGGGYFLFYGQDLGEPRDEFISDFLFTDSAYRAVMTCFVALQLGVCALFVTRLRTTRGDHHWAVCCISGPFMFWTEITLIVLAWVGWTILCAQYTDPNSHGMSKVHATGVGVFISCSLAYVGMMSWNVYVLFRRLSYLETAEFALLALLLGGSIALGIHFIYHALKAAPDAWVTEHLAFVLFVACHMLLFYIDSNNIRHVPPVVELSSVFDGVRIDR
jgi:hypothetical protein